MGKFDQPHRDAPEMRADAKTDEERVEETAVETEVETDEGEARAYTIEAPTEAVRPQQARRTER